MVEDALARDAAALAHAGRGLDEMYLGFDRLLRRHVDYFAAAWSTVDPATGLFTSCVMSGIERDPQVAARLFHYEFREDEPATYASIVTGPDSTAVLWDETDGELERAGRFREIFSHLGIADEIRGVFTADGVWWGNVVLYRQGERFSPADRAAVRTLTTHVPQAVRASLLRAAADAPQLVRDPPGVLLVHPDDTITTVTDSARRWAEEAGEHRLHAAAASAAVALRSQERWPGTSARVPTNDGRWLSLQATRADGDGGDVAVIVDLARPTEVAGVLLDAYELTPRQRDVLELALTGRTAIQIASALDISTYTANDHLKAIYREIGVNSRTELAARLQAEQYDPRKAVDVTPSPYGWFLEG